MKDESSANNTNKRKGIDILLVEDNEADVKITLRAFEKAKLQHRVHVASDGQEAFCPAKCFAYTAIAID